MKISKLTKLLYFAAFALLLFPAFPASAQVIFTQDQAEFLALNPNLQFQDFSGAPDPLPQVCINPATSSSNDGCFVPGRILPDIEFLIDPGLAPNALVLFEGNFFGNNNPPNVLASNVGGVGDAFDIVFTTTGINAVGFNAGCLSESGTCNNEVTVRVLVFGESGLIGSIVIPVTSAFNSFIGINTVEPITEISIEDDELDVIQGVLDVWFGTSSLERNIPTLSEWGMISAAAGLGLIGVLFAMMRRKRKLA